MNAPLPSDNWYPTLRDSGEIPGNIKLYFEKIYEKLMNEDEGSLSSLFLAFHLVFFDPVDFTVTSRNSMIRGAMLKPSLEFTKRCLKNLSFKNESDRIEAIGYLAGIYPMLWLARHGDELFDFVYRRVTKFEEKHSLRVKEGTFFS